MIRIHVLGFQSVELRLWFYVQAAYSVTKMPNMSWSKDFACWKISLWSSKRPAPPFQLPEGYETSTLVFYCAIRSNFIRFKQIGQISNRTDGSNANLDQVLHFVLSKIIHSKWTGPNNWFHPFNQRRCDFKCNFKAPERYAYIISSVALLPDRAIEDGTPGRLPPQHLVGSRALYSSDRWKSMISAP
jgi:hypothetical protein